MALRAPAVQVDGDFGVVQRLAEGRQGACVLHGIDGVGMDCKRGELARRCENPSVSRKGAGETAECRKACQEVSEAQGPKNDQRGSVAC
jgi:hypothetical protein